MKTIHILSTALLVLFSLGTFADDKNKSVKKSKTNRMQVKAADKFIKAPTFNWGEPTTEISDLTTSVKLSLPEFVWGEPTGITVEEKGATAKTATIRFPELVWGSPEEVLAAIPFPAFEWGNPAEMPGSID